LTAEKRIEIIVFDGRRISAALPARLNNERPRKLPLVLIRAVYRFRDAVLVKEKKQDFGNALQNLYREFQVARAICPDGMNGNPSP
jgi:hypothetical protein